MPFRITKRYDRFPTRATDFAKLIHYRTLMGGIARINVGPDRIPFEVHKKLLCDQSRFFDGKFKEIERSNNARDEIDLPQFHPNTFIEVVNWMYKGELNLAPRSSNYRSVCALCKIGDYLKMADFQREALNRLTQIIAGGVLDEFLAHAEEQGLLYDLESSSSDSEES